VAGNFCGLVTCLIELGLAVEGKTQDGWPLGAGMAAKRPRNRRIGHARSIEPLEVRYMMSGDSWGWIVGTSVDQGASIESSQPSSVVHHLRSNADFWIDGWDNRDLNMVLGEFSQTLASAHNVTGLSQVRNDYGFIGSGQTVAIIDSGIAWDHYALGGGFGSNYRVVGGWDFTEENDGVPYDDGPYGGHGTHVAGIVGADRNGTADDGVAPGVDLVSLRVFNDEGAGYFSWVENALRWVYQNRNAFKNPITAVNLSLGTSWNSESIPSWAMLEDEFAQLKNAGIFITVSAGNSFTRYQTIGLSYPAASPYVVPVMSVDDSGNLSSFSQRHPRAIGAPGQYIVSSVPDYIGNQNGKTDDFASFSGTSMAAPYVAGASVILREAMQFVGYAHITQDTIFNHMISTATTFFDAVTGQSYKRLNLVRALEVLMPSDDYGSTAATAYNLGTLSGSRQISGLIGKLSDADYFRFTAATTGTITFTATTTHGLQPVWNASGGSVSINGKRGESLTFDVVAGQTYTIGLATSGSLGFYTLSIDAQREFNYNDWGTIAQSKFNDYNIAGETWYRVRASQAGYFTAEAFFSSAGNNIDLAWFDANLRQVATGILSNNSARVERLVDQGEELYLRVRGVNADVDFRLTNLVSFVGSTLTINGTADADEITFTARKSQHLVTINGVQYQFNSSAVSVINLVGGSGQDRLKYIGSTARENFVIRQAETTVSCRGFALVAADFEDVLVYGGGGTDSAIFYDTPGDDQFTSWARRARLVGDGFYHEVRDLPQITAFATAGNDQATFYDSPSNDVFTGHSDSAVMQGNNYKNTAWRFDSTIAHATAGGYDRATFYDSSGNDIFTNWSDRAMMQGIHFVHVAWGFERTAAHATAGGYDEAVFYRSPGNDTYTFRPDRAILQGRNFFNVAWGFERATALVSTSEFGQPRASGLTSMDESLVLPDHFLLQLANNYEIPSGSRSMMSHTLTGNHSRTLNYGTTKPELVISLAWETYLDDAPLGKETHRFEQVGVHGSEENCDVPQPHESLDYVFGLIGDLAAKIG